MPDQTAAARQAKRRARLAEGDVTQINVLAPQAIHAALREIAARTRDGEPLHKVLRSLAMRATNQDARWAPLAVPDDLQPAPGEVAVAIRTGSRSNGYTRKLIDRAGLQRRDDLGAWCGIVTRDMADKLAARAETTTATVVERAGGE
ncbi:hypothetical protein VY88_10600 [Azospirillum thiophilum]|uniref:Uncharacterized protein n=1 Tax=Azospirillum thiophilum TaxID=528244 RepID=A0A0F2KNI6_9PROT|nr:hypothetical protein [Azospirillum thiophilum]ALG69915.1 hypothetical protein AL072_02110 [Azospirillum thiophilum]KJR61185.1 hypothetical protein VY88_33275 [Azospirillum thiophilum]KJR66399.1 hypothetical protein VY88_10600 [Azospirillum thiophilum]